MGRQNPEKFKVLYRATFDYFVKTKHLNNLLFIFEPSSSHKNAALYYPGSQYVDMIGISIFVPWNHELAPADVPAYSLLKHLKSRWPSANGGRGADRIRSARTNRRLTT